MIEKIKCTWMFFKESCHLTFLKEIVSSYGSKDIVVGRLAIRADVPYGDKSPAGWHTLVAPLEDFDRAEVSIDEVRKVLPAVADAEWEEPIAGTYETAVLSGRGKGLWLSFSKGGPPGVLRPADTPLSDKEITELGEELREIRGLLMQP